MLRYFVATYTDGPATRWNVIDRQTQEWVRRFSTKEAAEEYAAALEARQTEGRMTEAVDREYFKRAKIAETALKKIADGYGPQHGSKYCRDVAEAAILAAIPTVVEDVGK